MKVLQYNNETLNDSTRYCFRRIVGNTIYYNNNGVNYLDFIIPNKIYGMFEILVVQQVQ